MKTLMQKLTQLTAISLLAGTLMLPASARNINKAEWYVRLTAVNDTGLQDRSNVLGQLKKSHSGYDSHDLKELSPFGNRYLTIVFPHDDWEENAGDYSSDYHGRLKNDEWIFEVYTSEIDSDITLTWDATVLPKKLSKKKQAVLDPQQAQRKNEAEREKLMARMLLEDGETGEIFAVDGVQDYVFNMNGKSTRSFRWIKNKKLTKKWNKAQKRAARKAARQAKRDAAKLPEL